VKKLQNVFKIHLLSRITEYAYMLKSVFLPKTLSELPYNKFFTLHIPTYDQSAQAVHPDILYQSGNSPAFMLAFTPYPFSIDKFENPSILISNDGLHFFEEYPGLNPLVAAPSYDHNNDPNLFYYNGQLCIMYLETLRPERQNLVLLTHTGGGHWSPRIVHTDYLQAGDPMILSPVYVRIDHNDYLFYVNMTRYKIQFVPLKENFIPDCSARQDITINMEGFTPWHIDIIPHNDALYMLICCVRRENDQKKYDLYAARSYNGYLWTFSPNILINNSYRATGFFINDDMYIYYSRQTWFFLSWETGIVKKQLSQFKAAVSKFDVLKQPQLFKNFGGAYENGDNSKFIPFDF
jgi:hypothetical protein